MNTLKRVFIGLLFFALTCQPMFVYAQEDVVHLYSKKGISINIRHSDMGAYCFVVQDVMMDEDAAAALLKNADPEAEILKKMKFVLRKKSNYAVIENHLVEIDYSSLTPTDNRSGYPITFSYDDGTESQAVTAYLYVLGKQQTEETENPETEDMEESESQAGATDAPGMQQTETSKQTEPEESSKKPNKSKPSSTERLQPEAESAAGESGEVIIRRNIPHKEGQTEDKTTENAEETERKAGEVPGESERVPGYETEEVHEKDKAEDKETVKDQDTQKGRKESPIFILEFIIGGIASVLFFISILRDMKVIIRNDQENVEEMIKNLKNKRLKGEDK